MNECCGSQRQGKFCSECGKPLAPSPLLELLAHCRMTERKQQVESEKCQRSAEDKDQRPQDIRYDKEQARKRAEACAKWKARGDALAELLARTIDQDT